MSNPEEKDYQDLCLVHLRKGVPEAFKVLFFQFYPEFLSFAGMLVQDRVSAKNVTTEAFFLLWKKHADFGNEKEIKAFLYLTVRNHCLYWLRHSRKSPAVMGGHYQPSNITASALPDTILQDIFEYTAREL